MPKKDFLQGYSVVVPSNREFDNILPLLKCLRNQTIKPFEIIIVYDKDISEDYFKNYKKRVFSIFQKKENGQNLSDIDKMDIKVTIVSRFSHPSFKPLKGASFVRNFGIKLVNTKYLLCVDDDNEFENKFIENFISVYENTKNEKIIIPTEIYRKTGTTRSMGYCGFNHFLGRPKKLKVESQKVESEILKVENLIPISFSASNCLFGDTNLFQKNLFDENIPFVYEDFIMTRGLSKSRQNCLFVVTDIYTNHMMRDKTKIEDLYIANKFGAYQKGRNRIIFVKKYSNLCQKVVYFICGLRVHTLYLILVTLIYKKQKKLDIIKTLLKGTIDGIKMK